MKKNYFLPLSVNLTGEIRHHYNEKEELPAHNTVLRPIISRSNFIYVYGIKKDDDLYKSNSDILIPTRGKYMIDSSQECIKGHEALWNSTSWKRGSIVMSIPTGQLDWAALLKSTYRPGYNETLNSGNSVGAIQTCKKEMNLGNIAICLPASNGIEWMTIYAGKDELDKIYRLAKLHCNEPNYYG